MALGTVSCHTLLYYTIRSANTASVHDLDQPTISTGSLLRHYTSDIRSILITTRPGALRNRDCRDSAAAAAFNTIEQLPVAGSPVLVYRLSAPQLHCDYISASGANLDTSLLSCTATFSHYWSSAATPKFNIWFNAHSHGHDLTNHYHYSPAICFYFICA